MKSERNNIYHDCLFIFRSCNMLDTHPSVHPSIHPYICQSLTSLFNLSIETNIFPHELGIAKVSPLFKAGDHSDKENYRPISVIPTVARIFERIIYDQLYTYLIENELLNPQQSRFRSLHSTVRNSPDLDLCTQL